MYKIDREHRRLYVSGFQINEDTGLLKLIQIMDLQASW